MILKLGRIASKEAGCPDSAEFFATGNDAVAVLMLTRKDLEVMLERYKEGGFQALTIIGNGQMMNPQKVVNWAQQGWEQFLRTLPDHANPAITERHQFTAANDTGLLLPDPPKIG